MDMVPQKNADVKHDFEKDPIETWVDGEWLKAKGTTLGADNGLGVALALSVLESKDIKHGPLELLVTYDEETGMTGAQALKPGVLKGEILLNLDSETEGEIYVGCAGGLDASIKGTYERKPELALLQPGSQGIPGRSLRYGYHPVSCKCQQGWRTRNVRSSYQGRCQAD